MYASFYINHIVYMLIHIHNFVIVLNEAMNCVQTKSIYFDIFLFYLFIIIYIFVFSSEKVCSNYVKYPDFKHELI